MAKKVQTATQARDAFYEKAHWECGLTVTEVKEILLERFDSFNLQRLSEYMIVLKAEGRERREKQALEDKRTALRNRIPLPVEPDPCPIEGCTGHKVAPGRGESWAWVCSEGGLHHFLVDNISKTLGIAHNKFIIKLKEKPNATPQSDQPNQA